MATFRSWPICVAAAVSLLGCPKTTQLPEGNCAVSITASLSYAVNGAVVTVDATEAADTGIHVPPGTLVNLRFYFSSAFDFQYQADVALADNGLVVKTLVATQYVEVPSDDKSVYIFDVVPFETLDLLGAYSVNVGAHVNVNPDLYHCTGPLDANHRLVISNWRSMGLQVDAAGAASSSSSQGTAGSSGTDTPSSGGAASSN